MKTIKFIWSVFSTLVTITAIGGVIKLMKAGKLYEASRICEE